VDQSDSNYIFTSTRCPLKIALVSMIDEGDYWRRREYAIIGFPASALLKYLKINVHKFMMCLKFVIFLRAAENITINIGDGSKRLILPKWSSNLLKHELSSMRLVHCNETLANQM